jgi:hypothetical protein
MVSGMERDKVTRVYYQTLKDGPPQLFENYPESPGGEPIVGPPADAIMARANLHVTEAFDGDPRSAKVDEWRAQGVGMDADIGTFSVDMRGLSLETPPRAERFVTVAENRLATTGLTIVLFSVY